MVKIGNKAYYIDLKTLDKFITTDETDKGSIEEKEIVESYDSSDKVIAKQVTTKIYQRNKEIDAVKYESLKHMIEVIMAYTNEDTDNALGTNKILDEQPLQFKIAFNTLLFYGVIKEFDLK